MLNEAARPLNDLDHPDHELISEHSPAGLVLVRGDRIQYANPALLRMFGYQREELIDRLGLLELVEPSERERLQAMRQRRLSGDTRPLRTIFQAVRKDGTRFTCEVLARALQSAGELTLVGSLVDVTGRERAREQATRREHLLRGILSNSADGIVLIDEYAQIQEWNPGQERITGIPRSEVEGEPLFDILFRLMPADRRTIEAYVQLKESLAEYLRNPNAPEFGQPIEGEIVRPDGRKRSVQSLYFPVRQNGDQKVACVTRDVTERRMLERAEIEMLRTREQFVASVSRGLREPLDELIAQLELLRSGDELDESEREVVRHRAYASAAQLSELVSALTQASRFESGIELAMEEIDLRRILQQALDSVQQQAEEKGVPVAYSPNPDSPTVRANGPRLLQAVMSLIRNAIRMSESGSPVIVTAVAQDGEVTVQVTDQGPGIPSAAEPAVFAKRPPGLLPGEQQSDSGDLELYLSRKIIEAHGGHMGMRSQLGVGSTFYFSLPITNEPTN